VPHQTERRTQHRVLAVPCWWCRAGGSTRTPSPPCPCSPCIPTHLFRSSRRHLDLHAGAANDCITKSTLHWRRVCCNGARVICVAGGAAAPSAARSRGAMARASKSWDICTAVKAAGAWRGASTAVCIAAVAAGSKAVAASRDCHRRCCTLVTSLHAVESSTGMACTVPRLCIQCMSTVENAALQPSPSAHARTTASALQVGGSMTGARHRSSGSSYWCAAALQSPSIPIAVASK